MGINWKWNDTYTTTTTTDDTKRGIGPTHTTIYTTGDPIEIKAPEWKIGDKIEINSPIDIGVVGEPKGWICPRCGRVNAPWVSQCNCVGSIFKKIDTWSPSGIPEACRNCSNHPSNGGSGICNCTLGMTKITC